MCRVAGLYSVLVLFHLVRSFLCSKSCLVKHAMLKMLYLQGVSHFPRFPSYPSLCLSCTLLLFHTHYFPISSYSSLQRLSIYISFSFSHSLFLYHSFLFTQFSISLFDCSSNTRRNFSLSLSPPSLMPSSLPSPPFIWSIPFHSLAWLCRKCSAILNLDLQYICIPVELLGDVMGWWWGLGDEDGREEKSWSLRYFPMYTI